MSESTKKPEQAEENTTPETAPAEDTKKAEKKASKSSKKDRIAELEKELEKAQQSLKESADNFLRLAAEYDNFRKRSLREKDDIKIRSKTDVVEKLLPVIDNFERAAMNAEADADSYRKGVEQIYRQFGDILKALDIEAFGARRATHSTRTSTRLSCMSRMRMSARMLSSKCSQRAISSATRSLDPQSFRLPTDAARHFWNIN